MKTPQARFTRRNFLLTLGAGSAASAAAVVARKSASPGNPAAQPESPSGYRLTEHVRNYYRTAKI